MSHNPFDDLREFFTVLDSINTSFHTDPRTAGAGRFGSTMRSSGGFAPAVDISGTDDGYTLTADLPGCTSKDVDLKVHDKEICLTASRDITHAPEGDIYRRERRGGSFERCWSFSSSIVEDKVSAELTNGVLNVSFPLVKEGIHKNITIK
eukprot:TRINITY_DN4519_c0_g1_i1.p1 TRINITY_DN4519_c0_g1~~TRINITY_DN4519_c0_g1_i1.p1  ORF type:complete len:150 (+),score=37.35 TRINITY_DN4519_c0_g1_i1:39-488(+)